VQGLIVTPEEESEKLFGLLTRFVEAQEKQATALTKIAEVFGEIETPLKNLENIPVRLGEMIDRGIGEKVV
jgi:hypothetical protein